jgi:hypothetical protein
MTAKCMAILMAVERWRHYIDHYQFIIKTGHKSLKFLLEQRTHSNSEERFNQAIRIFKVYNPVQKEKGEHNGNGNGNGRCLIQEGRR